jgi:hypothetical protein
MALSKSRKQKAENRKQKTEDRKRESTFAKKLRRTGVETENQTTDGGRAIKNLPHPMQRVREGSNTG